MHNIEQLRAALAGPLSPMTQYRQFMLWRLETDPESGKPRKMPYSISGKPGRSTFVEDWCTADEALTYANAWQMGVAFVLTADDPFTFIDIDHCRNGASWSDDALTICNQFAGAAVEVSQSGEGLHIFTTGAVPEGFTGRTHNGIECYHKWRFVALTGNCNTGTAAHQAGAVLSQFITDRFPARTSVDGHLVWTVGAIPEAGDVPSDDEALLRAFLSAPPAQPRPDAYQAFAHLKGRDAVLTERIAVSNADLFNANAAVLSQAWPSDKGDAFDRSNAAFALACRLAMWTGKDCERMERLMYRAAFQRTRADMDRVRGQTYMRFDIMRACVAMTNVRKWNASDANAEVKQQGEQGYQAFYDRIAAAGDFKTVRAICEEAGYDLSIDKVYREMLAQHVQRHIEHIEQSRLPIADCRKLVAIRSSHPAPERQALQRQKNIAMNLPEETPTLTPVMSTAQMLDEFVFIADGSQVGSRYDRSACFSLSDFKNLMAASRTVSEDGTRIHADDWLTHGGRISVATRTFKAGGSTVTFDPNNRMALNMWRPRAKPREYTVDVMPFYEQVKYMFGDSTERFLDWMAHIEQFPGVLPHHGWLHIADHHGTGRNWLSSVISQLWVGYVAPSVDMDALINGGFNGVLAGRIIAIVDEIRAGARENAYMMESKIRNMLTEATRYIKPKYGKEYMEHNACRWLVFSNHKDAIPMDDKDRRWDVVHLSAEPRSNADYAYLYGLNENPAYIESIGAWLAQRDISQFNPGQRPPMSAAKMKAIEASRSDFQKAAANILEHWPCDFISGMDVHSIMNEDAMNGAGKKLTNAMRHALADKHMHYVDKQVYGTDGSRHRIWIVRNVNHWLADLSAWRITPELMKMAAIAGGTGWQKLNQLM